ncbi:MAG: helical backbone metal receptor [Bacteroidota bacterium]
MKTIYDQIGNKITLHHSVRKIVCLVPSLSELVVDLGLDHQLEGITKFCVHPSDLKNRKKIVGGTKSIHHNKIDEIKPDLIIANKEENTPEMVKNLQKKYTVYVSDINKIEDCVELIKDLGVIFEIEEKSAKLIHQIEMEQNQFLNFMKEKPVIKVAYFIWRKPWMVAANKTFINYLLDLCKFENAYKNLNRYPEISLNQLEQVDYVFLSSEPFPFSEKYFSEIPINSAQIKLVDGEFFSWYGSRLIKAFSYFKKLRMELENERN